MARMAEITEVELNIQTMKADNDTLIITDPCYILKEEHWDDFGDKNGYSDLDMYLRRYHNFGEVLGYETGFGDWSNLVCENETGKAIGRFCADAGMVMVCTASDLANYRPDYQEVVKDLVERECAAVIPDFTGEVKLSMETYKSPYGNYDNHWTVITGESEDGNDWHTLHATEDYVDFED